MENIMLNRNDITMYANIQIDANDSNFAQKYSIKIEDEFLRKKLFYTLSITSSVKNFLNNKGFNFNIDDSLFQLPQVLENYEYVDIYSHNLPIQVAYIFDNDMTVAIPKIHFEASIEPKMYLVARLHSNLNSFDLIGTINTNFLNKVNENNKYIYVDATSLNSINNLESDINKFLEDFEIIKNCEIFSDIKTNFISFIDKNLTIAESVDLIRHLSKCPQCREKLLYYYKFELMARSYAYDDDNLISDIDKYINNPDYLPDINDQIDNNNEEEQDENPEKEPDEYCYNYENEIDNDIKEDFVKTEDNFESNFVQNGFEQNVVDENKEDEQAIDEPVDDNFDEQIDSTNEVETAHIDDNSKLNLLYDENQTLQENIDDIEITNNKSSKKIIVVSVISALLFGSLCYFGVNFYKNKNIQDKSNNSSHIVANIPPENAQVDSQDAKTHEVLVPRPLKLSQISWEAPEIVLKTPVYNKYLIDVGKNLKINLQNQFIEINETVYQTKFQLQILIDTNGTVADVKILQASGNENVDNLIVSTTKQTLNYIKPPVVDSIKDPQILILEFEF